MMSPAYDLVNTRIHVDDPDFGLYRKLFADNFQSRAWKKNGHAAGTDFIEFGKRIGIPENRIRLLLSPFLEKQVSAETLISRSFLNDATKKTYLLHYSTRRNLLGAAV